MDKTLIRPLEGFMSIPQIVKVLGLSRARIHQLIEEDRFDIKDLRVVGDKRMLVIKNTAVYKQLEIQQKRLQQLVEDRAAEEQRLVGSMLVTGAEEALQHKPSEELAEKSVQESNYTTRHPDNPANLLDND